MDRRSFLSTLSAASLASITAAATLSEKADALEHAMAATLDRTVAKPFACIVDGHSDEGTPPFLMGNDPRLPQMPEKPSLIDFFKYRFAPADHLLQSARLALENGYDEKVVIACLVHDISVYGLMRTDHGYWCAQMIKPYVAEEVSWAIEKHQALRFFPDDSVDYAYPEAYIRFFGEEYKPEPYIEQSYREARKHKWYMTSRLITVNDLYSFEDGVEVDVDEFTDIVGRNFRQPSEGLGFDGSPTAHMWRTMIWPNNFL
ncbi:MAG: hypothetical protein OEW68_12885 [Gammaproteobacteria bacterium]|nr:hypothetical protein [Gammaproteobacteria bacterium]MDH4315728.1 hypothetical protein [Gammaproteobacteria bacterium]MDH5213438.1 hypothetical protein [Gammaproteobacteria bacterium]